MPDTSRDPGVLAARARIAAADKLVDAAMDEMHRMEEFTGKGDAVADELYAKAGERMRAAEAERSRGYDELAQADEAATKAADPQAALDAAKARVAAGEAELAAALKVEREMAEFGGKGDAVADEILRNAAHRAKVANAEIDSALGEQTQATLDVGRAARAQRDAATPVDALLVGALATEATEATETTEGTDEQSAAPPAARAPGMHAGDSSPSRATGPMTRTEQATAAANRDYSNALKARGCLSPAILAVLGAGTLVVVVLVLIGSQLSPGPATPGGTPDRSVVPNADATGSPEDSTGPGTTTGGAADFAGRWALVEGLDDPNGYDVAYYTNPNPPPGEVTIHPGSSGYFDIDATGAIVSGQYHTALTSTVGCSSPNQGAKRDFVFDSKNARGQADAAGNGTVIWDGTKTIAGCPGGTELVQPENVFFQFHIVGEQMVICRSNTTAELGACADPYPRRVALFARVAPT